MKVRVREKGEVSEFVPIPPQARQQPRPAKRKPKPEPDSVKNVEARDVFPNKVPRNIGPEAIRSAQAGTLRANNVLAIRYQLEQIEQSLGKIENPERLDRMAHWAVRMELRKLRLLDHFLNRFIGG